MRDITSYRRMGGCVAILLINTASPFGLQVSPTFAQDAAMVEVDRAMENYRLDAPQPARFQRSSRGRVSAGG